MATWDLSKTKHHVLICNGSSCMSNGAEELTQAIRKEIRVREADEVIHTTRTRCNGRCHDKSVVIAYPEGRWYKDMKEEEASSFIGNLLGFENCTTKVSHSYVDGVFLIGDGIQKGVEKEKKLVQKVLK
ncbi:(2Fe-2S) ferredoxin domain-containing protein [Bacillus sp. DJP31]|uniref:(2Fe-2S) ferredoxin domain-containing protein n=1 Tax=Bacillus sp. DJP31 TaxID=3409789 RepID=UPI003BB504A2